MQKSFARLGVLLVVFVVAMAALACREAAPSESKVVDDAAAHSATSERKAPGQATPRPGREDFVGSETCASCHAAQAEAYRGSHHAKALVTPSQELNAARFNGSQFATKHGGLTKFSLADASPRVTTKVAGAASQTFELTHVSGVWPIEQYVVATERGKLQALSVAWDSRDKSEGGQRWFHIYGAEGVAPTDPLFFTSPAQNWNHMCAECHSTYVERRYDVESDSFDTRWTELSVGCEACHGPGKEHVRSAQAKEQPVVRLPVRLGATQPWLPGDKGSPVPHAQDAVQTEACAPCHSRREPIKEGFLASDPFLDAFEPELLLPGRYHADGQVEGEVYEWASFQQSRMFQAGVTCSDCHNPHSGKLHAEDNNLCLRCHDGERFNTPSHTHHAIDKAPLCIDCHMPPSTFMQIDERRDHSIRIPRPDHSELYGTPNACNGCHTKESASWAREKLEVWAPGLSARPHFVDALGKDRKGAPDAHAALRKLAADKAAPSIARATALERLNQYPGPKTLAALQAGLRDPDALVVYGAVQGTAQLPLAQRVPALLSALEHPVRVVRVAAAKQLAQVPQDQLPEAQRPLLSRAFNEVLESFAVSASRPETHVEASAFALAQGQHAEAERALQRALKLQPCLAEAHLNLADVARQRGDEAQAEREIRAAIQCSPQNAAAHHALGLWQVRAKQAKEALRSLKKASELAPTETRFGYVYAVALFGNAEPEAAIAVLEGVAKQRPNDVNALQALAAYLQQTGRAERAQSVLAQLRALQAN